MCGIAELPLEICQSVRDYDLNFHRNPEPAREDQQLEHTVSDYCERKSTRSGRRTLFLVTPFKICHMATTVFLANGSDIDSILPRCLFNISRRVRYESISSVFSNGKPLGSSLYLTYLVSALAYLAAPIRAALRLKGDLTISGVCSQSGFC